ncbi:MAG: hypothetical protein AB1714_05495 [Acidobacteriota bacterium]
MSAAHKPPARDLLARLVGRDELAMHGKKKGAFHERASKHMENSKCIPSVTKERPSDSKQTGVNPRSGAK